MILDLGSGICFWSDLPPTFFVLHFWLLLWEQKLGFWNVDRASWCSNCRCLVSWNLACGRRSSSDWTCSVLFDRLNGRLNRGRRLGAFRRLLCRFRCLFSQELCLSSPTRLLGRQMRKFPFFWNNLEPCGHKHPNLSGIVSRILLDSQLSSPSSASVAVIAQHRSLGILGSSICRHLQWTLLFWACRQTPYWLGFLPLYPAWPPYLWATMPPWAICIRLHLKTCWCWNWMGWPSSSASLLPVWIGRCSQCCRIAGFCQSVTFAALRGILCIWHLGLFRRSQCGGPAGPSEMKAYQMFGRMASSKLECWSFCHQHS